MNIVFVTYHTCARAQKMAKALISEGHQVIILQHLAASQQILYEQQLSSFYGGPHDLSARVNIFNDWADIFHVHNEPDWLVWITAEAAESPVVYDCHDLNSQRLGQADQNEVKAFAAADACIFPSLAYAYGAIKYHNINRKAFPFEVVFSMCNKEDRPLDYQPKIDALVYEGHHIAPVEGTDFKPGFKLYYHYRDYRSFILACTTRDIPTALFGTRKDFEESYRQRGALVNPMLPFSTMMRELTRYSWGFCGHPEDYPQWQKAMPNKLFEYLTAGLPIIAWNCAEVEMFVQGHDVGVVVKSYDDLHSAFHDCELWQQKKYNVDKLWEDGHFNMEIQVPKILALYDRAAKYRKEKGCKSSRTPSNLITLSEKSSKEST